MEDGLKKGAVGLAPVAVCVHSTDCRSRLRVVEDG